MMSNIVIIVFTSAVLLYRDVYALENLALNKSTWQEHPWADLSSDYGSENAVDGLYTDRSFSGGQCTVNADGYYTAEWRVDLGSVVSISHINIYYRTNNKNPGPYVNRMAGFSIYVSNTTSKDQGHLCYKDQSSGHPSVDQRITCSIYGRYVIYYNERNRINNPSYLSKYAYNELCELEVYDCPSGYYGNNCSNQCSINCNVANNCDRFTGLCDGGCKPGWTGNMCDQVCESGFYGKSCSNQCSLNCIVTNNCDRVTGQCDGGCKPGWTGNTCSQKCTIGYYGKDCLKQCSTTCNVTASCDRISGQCGGGCKPGWTGNTCDKKVCDNGYVGAECNRKCGHCLKADHCHHINGSCLNGCSHGYKGDYCNETCPPGFFGLDCINRCDSFCAGNKSCDPVMGICTEGCKRGWSGLMCGLDRFHRQSYGDNMPIVIGVVVSVVIFLGGSIMHLILWRRKTDGSSETSQQYTELGYINKSSNYDEIHSYSNH